MPLLLSLILSLQTPTAPVALASGRPNILFILTDDQRFDSLSGEESKRVSMPSINGLLSGGAMEFSNTFVTTPICAASRASILTGSYERRHKYTFGTPPLSTDLCENSYPALLRKAGYRTGLFGKVGVNYAPGEAGKMFDRLVSIGYPYQRKMPNGETRHIDQIATDRAIEFLKEQPADKPFCLSLSFNSPHAQDGQLDDLYPSPKTVEGLFDDRVIPPPDFGDEKVFQAEPEFLRKSMNRIRWFWQFDTREKYVKNVRAYYRMIAGLDVEIKRLFDELSRLRLKDNTVIIFMSDNGYFLGERGFSGKWIHYEQSLRVPMVIYDPKQSHDAKHSNPSMVLNIDIAPTILDYAGVKIPKEMQGRTLKPFLRGADKGWRKDFFCEHLMVEPTIPQWEGVRGQRYVYARYFGQNPAFEFLHDLEKDPNELMNLAKDPKYADVLVQSRKRMSELRDASGGLYSRERFPLLKDK